MNWKIATERARLSLDASSTDSVRHIYYTTEKQRISGILKSSHYKWDKGSNATEKDIY